MKHIIDIETWERRDNYNFFRNFHNSWISITSEVDCTEAFPAAKAAKRSFFLYYLYAVLRAANEVKEFRFRTHKNGQVVITIRWTSYHLSLYPARLSTQSASLTMQILNGFMPKHITSSITSPKRVTRMEPKKSLKNREILILSN